MRFFSLDSPIFKFLSLVYDLIILNLLYVITCLPVLTIGAATSALYRTVLDMRYERDAGAKAYLRNFKNNLRQSTPRYLLFVLISAVLCFDIWFTQNSELHFPAFMVPLFLALLTVCLALSSWVLALTGQFDNTTKGTVKNAAILAPRHLMTTILLLLRFVPLLLFLFHTGFFLITAILYFLIYYSAAAYLCAMPMSRLFLDLMTPEEAAKRNGGPEDE